ncbi:hypothetical protein Tco_0270592 [Tanacetum coccineum]
MDSDKYLEGKSMQRPPLFESDIFVYWKNRFETYVKSKDLDLWHVITEGDFQPIQNNLKTKLDEVILARTMLGSFFRAQHPKWREKAMTIEESKDLTSLSLDELIENLKVHELIIKKDSEIVKGKGERKSLALKAKKESTDEEISTSGSEDEEYAMAVRDFKKFFKRRGRCGDPNHLIEECLKPPRDKNQRAFIGDSWSDNDEQDDEKTKDETCFMAQASSEICLGIDLEPDEWIKDSGCSKHMTGNRKLFSTYKAYNGEHVDNLGFNLLSVSQICDNMCQVLFSEHISEIVKNGKVIASKELVGNLPKLKFDQHFCDACKIGKQAHASHKAKNMVSTTRCLELLHMDVFGPSAVRSYGGNLYTLVIVDNYSRTDHDREFDNEVQFGEFCNADGYSQNSKAYIILNKHTMKIKESLNMTFDETPPPSKTSPVVDDNLDEEEAIKVTEKKNLEIILRMEL